MASYMQTIVVTSYISQAMCIYIKVIWYKKIGL